MSTWDAVLADTGRRHHRSVRVLLGVYLGAFAAALVSERAAVGAIVVLALTWLPLVVASVRALRHAYEQRTEEGRTLAYTGLLVTLGPLAFLVAYALRPSD